MLITMNERKKRIQSNNETKFKLNIPKMMEFQMTFIISMDSHMAYRHRRRHHKGSVGLNEC